MNITLVVLVVTNLALIIGWIVTGTQRTTEALTNERRAAYADLLVAAQRAASGATPGPDPATADDDPRGPTLAELSLRAEFLATDEMLSSRLIRRLVESTESPAAWPGAKDAFMAVARFDSHHNSSRLRRQERHGLYGLPKD